MRRRLAIVAALAVALLLAGFGLAGAAAIRAAFPEAEPEAYRRP